MDRDVSPLRNVPSTSKLRRSRAAAVKRKLHERSHRDDHLYTMTSQVAMLTTSIDTLVSLFNFQQYVPTGACSWQSNLDPLAAELTPTDSWTQAREKHEQRSGYFKPLLPTATGFHGRHAFPYGARTAHGTLGTLAGKR